MWANEENWTWHRENVSVVSNFPGSLLSDETDAYLCYAVSYSIWFLWVTQRHLLHQKHQLWCEICVAERGAYNWKVWTWLTNLSRKVFSLNAPMQPAKPRMNMTPPTTIKSHTGSKPPRSVIDDRLDSTPWGNERKEKEWLQFWLHSSKSQPSHLSYNAHVSSNKDIDKIKTNGMQIWLFDWMRTHYLTTLRP